MSAGLLAACQPLPQPFQTEDRSANPLLTIRDSAGIVIRPPTGLSDDLGDRLANAIVASFHDDDLPAAIDVGNRFSSRLTGTAKLRPVVAGEAELIIDWAVTGADGKLIGNFTQREPIPHEAGPDQPSRKHLRQIADRTVKAIMPILTDPPVHSAVPDSVAVWTIDGAPGDGAISLKRALEFVMRQNGITVSDGKTDNTMLVVAAITMGKPQGGAQAIAIRWSVLYPDGTEIGAVSQSNQIKAGSLDGMWADTAFLVAEAAFDGIATLLERSPAMAPTGLLAPPADMTPASLPKPGTGTQTNPAK